MEFKSKEEIEKRFKKDFKEFLDSKYDNTYLFCRDEVTDFLWDIYTGTLKKSYSTFSMKLSLEIQLIIKEYEAGKINDVDEAMIKLKERMKI